MSGFFDFTRGVVSTGSADPAVAVDVAALKTGQTAQDRKIVAAETALATITGNNATKTQLDAAVATLETSLAGKVDQSVFDVLRAGNATAAQLQAVRDAIAAEQVAQNTTVTTLAARVTPLETQDALNKSHIANAGLHNGAATTGQFMQRQADGSVIGADLTIVPANARTGAGSPPTGLPDEITFWQQADAARGGNDLWQRVAGEAWPAQANFKTADPETSVVADFAPDADRESTPLLHTPLLIRGLLDGELRAQHFTPIARLNATRGVEPTVAETRLLAVDGDTAKIILSDGVQEDWAFDGTDWNLVRTSTIAAASTHHSIVISDSSLVHNIVSLNLEAQQRVRFHSHDGTDRAMLFRPETGVGKTVVVNGSTVMPNASGNVSVAANEATVWQTFKGEEAGVGTTYIWTRNATPAAASSVVYLIEGEGSHGVPMSIRTGQNWQEIESEFTEVRIDLSVSDSGRAHIVPESITFRPAYLRGATNGTAGAGFSLHDSDGVKIWVDPISLADRSLVYRESSGDDAANGRCRFNLVGIR